MILFILYFQEKQNEITTLSSKLKTTEDSMRKMKQKFE